jgi:hypothetical protein
MAINKRRERICYEHPENDQLVIKIPLCKSGRKSRANHHELKGYLLLREEKKDLSFVSHCRTTAAENSRISPEKKRAAGNELKSVPEPAQSSTSNKLSLIHISQAV